MTHHLPQISLPTASAVLPERSEVGAKVRAMFRLTKRSVEKLETKDKEYFVWDSELSGFGVRVMPSRKRW